jgi:hypothetical protein
LALAYGPKKSGTPPDKLATKRKRGFLNSRKMRHLLSRYMGQDTGKKGKGEEPESKSGNKPELAVTAPTLGRPAEAGGVLRHAKGGMPFLQHLKERVEAQNSEEQREGVNQSAGIGAVGGLSEQKALNTLGMNQATAVGEPLAVTPGAEREAGPAKQEEEEVAEVFTEGTLAKEVLTEGNWACRSLTAVSEKLKAGESLEEGDIGMGTESAEAGVVYDMSKVPKVGVTQRGHQASLAKAAGAALAPEKAKARSPKPSSRFETSSSKITREEQEALVQGLAHPPLWAEDGHLKEYGNQCGRDCGCCKGMAGALAPGPYCKICRKVHDLKLFTDVLGVK